MMIKNKYVLYVIAFFAAITFVLIVSYINTNATIAYTGLVALYILSAFTWINSVYYAKKSDETEEKLRIATEQADAANKRYLDTDYEFRQYIAKVELEKKINDTSHIQLTHTTEMMIDVYQTYQRTKTAFAQYVATRTHCSEKAAQKIVADMLIKQPIPDIEESDIYNKLIEENNE